MHLSHGIARYRGMQVLDKTGQTEEHLILEFRGGTRVYVPASKIDLVQKYVGGAKTDRSCPSSAARPGSSKKERVEEAVLDLASDMVELQALREAQPGVAFPPDSDWQREFEAAFPYQETPDQLTTLGEIKRDMERARPMDRLICGDVGYGKTELADPGRVQDHRQRQAGRRAGADHGAGRAALPHLLASAWPSIRSPSRSSAASARPANRSASSKRLAEGEVDVIIGTHRLVSDDVQFKDLGLVIIDEEQRFGVEHKERLKKLRQTVDVLTLTATPIPRTLHLSLLGIRDISNLETPPPDRLAIETRIIRFDQAADSPCHPARTEPRGADLLRPQPRSQHPRHRRPRCKSIVPEARIVIGHGQMHEHELEQAMVQFVRREADILVATTIIESGLDIPNANTIFINQADNYGLADLHQLRGRVGRYKHRAYAYMLLDAIRPITPTASRRLKAIEEFTELGAGFKIAMRDLEIRGAGNILGTQQSGPHRRGRLRAVLPAAGKRRPQDEEPAAQDAAGGDASICPGPPICRAITCRARSCKIEVYRRLARIRQPGSARGFPPGAARPLRRLCPSRSNGCCAWPSCGCWPSRWQIATVHLEGKGVQEKVNKEGTKSITLDPLAGPIDVVLGYRNRHKMEKLVKRTGVKLRIVDALSAYYRLEPKQVKPLALFESIRELLRLPERRTATD